MIRSFVLAAVLCASSAWAQVQEPVPAPVDPAAASPDMSSLGFFVPQHRIAMSVGYGKSAVETTIKYLGANFSKSKQSTESLAGMVVYGLADRFELALQATLNGSSVTDTTYGPAHVSNGTTASFKEQGADNPLVGGRYRLPVSSESTTFFSFQYQPYLIKSKSSTSKTNGTFAGAQSTANIEGVLVRSIGSMELQGSLKRVQKFDGSSENADTGVTTDMFGGHSTTIAGEFRVHNAGGFFWGGQLGLVSYEGSSTQSTGGKTDVASYSTTRFGAVIGSKIGTDGFVSVTYLLMNPASSKATSGANTFDVSQENVSTLGLSAGWLF